MSHFVQYVVIRPDKGIQLPRLEMINRIHRLQVDLIWAIWKARLILGQRILRVLPVGQAMLFKKASFSTPILHASVVSVPGANSLPFLVLSTNRPPHLPHSHGFQSSSDLLPLLRGVLGLGGHFVLVNDDKSVLLIHRNSVHGCVQPHLHSHRLCLLDSPLQDDIGNSLAPVVGVGVNDVQIW